MARRYVVIGHLTPTDDSDPTDDPGEQGKLDAGVSIQVCRSEEAVREALNWYLDGIVRVLP